MRLATVRTPRGARLHVRGAAGYVDAGDATGDDQLSTLTGLLALGSAGLDALRPASERAGQEVAMQDLAPAGFGARRFLCLGLNYGDHARETGWTSTPWPEIFVRGAQSLVGPADDIVAPSLSSQLDYEGELAVVIGAGGRYIPAERALDAVLGFSVVNEVTARDWQRASKQWTPGKNFDSTMPMGADIVTTDEVDADDLAVTTTLNGTVMQSARTSQMLTSIGKAIEFISSFTTLAPGDIIATGTPAGVGFTRTPAVFLLPGDVVEVTIENIGTIRNRVVAEDGAPAGWPWVVPVRHDGIL